MNAVTPFPKPVRVSGHCRHYSYELDPRNFATRGPQCARGVNLGGLADTRKCMPDSEGQTCALREEFSEADRAAWQAYRDGCLHRLMKAVGALPSPIPIGTASSVECPNCGGDLTYSRTDRSALIQCSTENCCSARYTTECGANWPVGGPGRG